MPEAYIFSTAQENNPDRALAAALRSAGLQARALSELVWLPPIPQEFPDGCPFAALPDGPSQVHFVLQTLLRRFQAGERGLVAYGQASTCLILGGPAAIGRLNLLPAFRLHPSAPLPAGLPALMAAENLCLSLAPPPPKEPSSKNRPPQIITPAAPPELPATPEPPVIRLLLSESEAAPLFPAARMLPPATGLPGLIALLSALSPEQTWGAFQTPIARGSLLTLVEEV